MVADFNPLSLREGVERTTREALHGHHASEIPHLVRIEGLEGEIGRLRAALRALVVDTDRLLNSAEQDMSDVLVSVTLRDLRRARELLGEPGIMPLRKQEAQ